MNETSIFISYYSQPDKNIPPTKNVNLIMAKPNNRSQQIHFMSVDSDRRYKYNNYIETSADCTQKSTICALPTFDPVFG